MPKFIGTSGHDIYRGTLGQNVGFTISSALVPANTFLAGAGDDLIDMSGIVTPNIINGGAGCDTLLGGAGADTFLIGAPGDLVAGETYSGGRGLTGGFTTDRILLSSTAAGAETYDFRGVTLINISGFNFSYTSTSTGGARTAIFSGDQIQLRMSRADFALSPNLVVTGSLANDTMIVNIGHFATLDLAFLTFMNWTPSNDVVVIQGDADSETIRGTAGKDEILSGLGNDTISATAGDDIYNGQDGIDTVVLANGTNGASVALDHYGNAATSIGTGTISLYGIENLTGSAFADQFFGNASANRLVGNLGNDALQGRDGNDFLDGGAGSDKLEGGNGSDNLYGGDGHDLLFGDNANDFLDGGAGNDTLNGGGGRDIFRMFGNGGKDWVVGFEDGFDRIDMRTSGAGAFANLSITQVGVDTVITYVGANTVTLHGIAVSHIGLADFMF